MSKQERSPQVKGGFSLEMPRRDFILFSSAAVLGIATTGLGSTISPSSPAAMTDQPIALSVGYWSGLVETDYGVRRTWPLQAGEAVSAGERAFLDNGVAQVKMYGFWRSPLKTREPMSLTVIPRYPVTGLDSKINVLALNYVDRGNGNLSGSPRTFTVPIGADGVFDLALDHRSAVTLPVGRSRAVSHPPLDPAVGTAFAESVVGQILSFRGDDQSASLKLRRGTYVIAVGSKPDWSSVRIVEQSHLLKSAEGPLVTAWTEQPVAFDYIVFSLDSRV